MVKKSNNSQYIVVEKNLPSFKTFGERLVFLRDMRDLSRSDLSKLINKHHSIVGKYETGDRTPSDNNIYILSDALKISPIWLQYGTAFYLGDLDNWYVYKFCVNKNSELNKQELLKSLSHNIDILSKDGDLDSLKALESLSTLLSDKTNISKTNLTIRKTKHK